ncbi:MAG: hypothetical protein ACRD96_16805 [Bryobacteraceae bacterium]
MPTGHIVYAVAGTLFAVAFDERRLEVTGQAAPVVEGVRHSPATGAAQFSVSNTGSLVFIPGPASPTGDLRDLVLIDRKGGVERLKLPRGGYESPRISPNGRQVAFSTVDTKEAIVWIYDLSGTSARRRLTFGGRNRFPIWSADGQRVAFQSDRDGAPGIYWQRADGADTAERLTTPEPGTSHIPESWSPKGDRLSFSAITVSNASLWMVSLQDKKAAPFGEVRSSLPLNSAFSPDGRWVAYTFRSRETVNVFVEPFLVTGAKYQVSKDNGSRRPIWSPDGKALFYQTAEGLVVVSVSTQPSFTVGNPEALSVKGVSTSAGSPTTTSRLTANDSLSLPPPRDPTPGNRLKFRWSTGSRS